MVDEHMPERPSPLQHIVDISDATAGAPAHRPRGLLNERRSAGPDAEATPEVSRAYLPWSAFEDAFSRQEFLRGSSPKAIGAALGRSAGSVRSRLRKLDVREDDIGRPVRPASGHASK